MGEIKNEIEDTGGKLKAAAEAAVNKVMDPDRDIESDYKNAQRKETLEEEPSSGGSSTARVSRLTPSIPQYRRIMVPDDNSELSDKALSHAIYLSNVTGAEIVILNIVKDIGKIQPTTISATSTQKETEKGGKEEIAKEPVAENISNTSKEDIEITIEGQAEQMMEERIRLCKEAGAKNQISYKMLTGKKLVDEILEISEKMDIDLTIMASSKVTSPVMGLTSITRKVIDGSNNPVLVIYQEEQ